MAVAVLEANYMVETLTAGTGSKSNKRVRIIITVHEYHFDIRIIISHKINSASFAFSESYNIIVTVVLCMYTVYKHVYSVQTELLF